MEAILVIVFFLFGGFIIRSIFAGLGAAGRTLVGDGTFTENINRSFGNIGNFEVRLKDETIDDIVVKKVEFKGLIPTNGNSLNLRVVLRDTTEGTEKEEAYSVISLIESFQAPDSKVFFHSTNLGPVEFGLGFHKWVELSRVVPNFLVPPYKGKRQIQVLSLLYDSDNTPLWVDTKTFFELDFSGTGYLEQSEHDKKARALTVKIAVAVAMSDGQLANSEEDVIKDWIQKTINIFEDENTRKELKELYNNSYKNAVKESQNNELSLSTTTRDMNEYADDNIKYQSLSLCYDVMIADGEIANEELDIIKNLSKVLNLDFSEVEKMRDKKMVSFDTSQISKESIEDILGIDESISEDQKRTLLREEFKKWNDRLTSLDEGPERDNAQRMINLISEAIQKYK